jgi:hypothetical protein
LATAVDICNLGLSHIGARAQIAAISPPDGSVEAGLCARFYPLVRREMLESHSWSFALKRETLAEVANDSTIWAYAYTLPADCIKPRRVLPLQVIEAYAVSIDFYAEQYPDALVQTLFTERGSSRFEVEGNTLRTNEPDAVLLYTRDIADTNVFSPMFVSAAGMLMGSYLAGPIIKGEAGAKAAASWRQAAMNLAASAAASNANASNDRSDFMPSSLAARQ